MDNIKIPAPLWDSDRQNSIKSSSEMRFKTRRYVFEMSRKIKDDHKLLAMIVKVKNKFLRQNSSSLQLQWQAPAQLKSGSENGEHKDETAKYNVRLSVSIFQVDEDNSGAIDFDEFLRMMGNRLVGCPTRLSSSSTPQEQRNMAEQCGRNKQVLPNNV